MSSMLRQHHVKIQDLVSYLRGYDPSKPQTAEDWSKQESAGFEPGMLIFCLERVSAPSGLAFGKKDTEGETYRVKDLCVVVGRDNNRSLVVNITASAFELRYLEVLMLEKARKAILDGKDFLYVAVKPAQPLPESKLREIEELGAMYAQGGSRRSLVVDASGPQEPAVALLAALGVKLSVGGIGKQVLDIGSICHMLFAPEGRQEDKNKALVKTCFAAIPNNEPIGQGGQSSAFNGTAPRAQRVPSRPAPSQPPQTVEWAHRRPPPGHQIYYPNPKHRPRHHHCKVLVSTRQQGLIMDHLKRHSATTNQCSQRFLLQASVMSSRCQPTRLTGEDNRLSRHHRQALVRTSLV